MLHVPEPKTKRHSNRHNSSQVLIVCFVNQPIVPDIGIFCHATILVSMAPVLVICLRHRRLGFPVASITQLLLSEFGCWEANESVEEV